MTTPYRHRTLIGWRPSPEMYAALLEYADKNNIKTGYRPDPEDFVLCREAIAADMILANFFGLPADLPSRPEVV